MDPAFSCRSFPSLLDRGFVYAIAHVRGGQEMGRAWYDAGHLLNKKNTFTDFIDVTRYLVAHGYAAKDRVAASGGSAGGLLMGAIANMAPQDYRVIVAQVPFVDVVTTMLDASIPLTTNEFDEWGNPAERSSITTTCCVLALRQGQPPGLSGDVRRHRPVGQPGPIFRAGQVVAKLRAMKTDTNPLVFRINMEAGARRQVGPVRAIRSRGEYYAFMLWQLGVARAGPPEPSAPKPLPRAAGTGRGPSFS